MVYAVIVAGGSGSRMKSDLPKQFLELQPGRTVLQYTVDIFFQAFPQHLTLILVLPEDFLDLGKSLFSNHPRSRDIVWVAGGTTRFHSVQNGLQQIGSPGMVFVHDAVRPCISVDFLHRLQQEAEAHGHVIPCVEVKDSLREVAGTTSHSVDRSLYRAVQTPQVFRSDLILQAFTQIYKNQFTDEASVAEAAGMDMHLCAGLEENIKITRPADLELARILVRQADPIG
jgi:2-C-methyl-D-erythritol 4-phosphate cytidylyltransferase